MVFIASKTNRKKLIIEFRKVRTNERMLNYFLNSFEIRISSDSIGLNRRTQSFILFSSSLKPKVYCLKKLNALPTLSMNKLRFHLVVPKHTVIHINHFEWTIHCQASFYFHMRSVQLWLVSFSKINWQLYFSLTIIIMKSIRFKSHFYLNKLENTLQMFKISVRKKY